MSERSGRNPKRAIPDNWDWLDALTGPFDDDFIAAVNEEVPQQERPEIDAFFHSLPEPTDEG
ncbi:MAG TPA: hypothetical protein VFC56_02490 [Stellaceae bacterium]|nr:hypothetical protein [Stellaceae bacterium]